MGLQSVETAQNSDFFSQIHYYSWREDGKHKWKRMKSSEHLQISTKLDHKEVI